MTVERGSCSLVEGYHVFERQFAADPSTGESKQVIFFGMAAAS